MNTFLNLVGGDNNLKNQIKELKDQNDTLLRENDILKKFYFDTNDSSSNRLFNRLLSDMKTAFFEDDKIKNDSVGQFKNFLIENSVFYYGLEDDEVTALNEVKINDADWSRNKDLFLLKQRLIERNYRLLIANIKENEILKDVERKLEITKEVKVTSEESNKDRNYFNIKEDKEVIEEVNLSIKSNGDNRKNNSLDNLIYDSNNALSNNAITGNNESNLREKTKNENDKKPFTLKPKQNKDNLNDKNDLLMALVEDSLIKTIQPNQSQALQNQKATDKKDSNKRFLWDEEEEFN